MHVCAKTMIDLNVESMFYLPQNNPADNLLSEDTFRKWSCANAGEKQASVVLQVTAIFVCSLVLRWTCIKHLGVVTSVYFFEPGS